MRILNINLRAFGEGAGAAAPAASAGGNNAAPAQPQTSGSAPDAPAQQAAQAPNGQAQNGQAAQAPTGQPEKPSFDDLIKGDYKRDFEGRVQEILARRLKSRDAELGAMRPILALLQQRYGIEDGKDAAQAVRQALEKDADYWQSAADKLGMTGEQYRRMVSAEAKSREMQAILAAQQTEQRRNETYQRLNAEAEQVKAQYPAFDVEAELRSGNAFGDLLRSGIDMLTAYQVCHQQEFLAAAQQAAETKAQDKIRANQARPAENGTGGGQPAKLSGDPSKWTREQFREVERRVMRGERICL